MYGARDVLHFKLNCSFAVSSQLPFLLHLRTRYQLFYTTTIQHPKPQVLFLKVAQGYDQTFFWAILKNRNLLIETYLKTSLFLEPCVQVCLLNPAVLGRLVIPDSTGGRAEKTRSWCPGNTLVAGEHF